MNSFKDIDVEVLDSYQDEENPLVVLDGIIDETHYWKSAYRVLWVLLEPHIDEDAEEWDSREKMRESPEVYASIPTWRTVCIAMKMIQNGTPPQQVIADENWQDQILKLAYININKLPAETTSSNYHSRMRTAYEKHKDVLLKQIKTYNPQIVIFSGTQYLFYNDLHLSPLVKGDFPGMNGDYHLDEERLYIDIHYHPNAPVNKLDYFYRPIQKAVSHWEAFLAGLPEPQTTSQSSLYQELVNHLMSDFGDIINNIKQREKASAERMDNVTAEKLQALEKIFLETKERIMKID